MLEAVVHKMFLNVIKLEAKVKDSPTIPKIISEETDKKVIKKNTTLIRKKSILKSLQLFTHVKYVTRYFSIQWML